MVPQGQGQGEPIGVISERPVGTDALLNGSHTYHWLITEIPLVNLGVFQHGAVMSNPRTESYR